MRLQTTSKWLVQKNKSYYLLITNYLHSFMQQKTNDCAYVVP